MDRVEEQLWQREQDFLYGAGCQMESEFDLTYECDCGHSCEAGDEHKVNGESLCPDCYSKFVENLSKKCSQIIQAKFTQEELGIMYEEGILGDV